MLHQIPNMSSSSEPQQFPARLANALLRALGDDDWALLLPSSPPHADNKNKDKNEDDAALIQPKENSRILTIIPKKAKPEPDAESSPRFTLELTCAAPRLRTVTVKFYPTNAAADDAAILLHVTQKWGRYSLRLNGRKTLVKSAPALEGEVVQRMLAATVHNKKK